MAKKTNPFADFDMTKMMFEFDPTKIASQYKVPQVDVEALMAIQRKNMEALTTANKVAIEGAQAMARRQADILQETMAVATKALEGLTQSASPQEAAAKQAEFLKGAFEKTVANMRELRELMTKSNTEAADAIAARICESLDEIKEQALKAN